jgi:hypothetical protein
MSDEKKSYEVGYKKPPKQFQFKKGEPSRNPRGRKKGVRNFATLTREALSQKVTVIDKGVKRRMTTQEVIVQQVLARAMKGDLRAVEQIFKFNPRIRGEDLVKKAEKTLENWLDSMTDVELDKFTRDLEEQTAHNKQKSKQSKIDNRPLEGG